MFLVETSGIAHVMSFADYWATLCGVGVPMDVEMVPPEEWLNVMHSGRICGQCVGIMERMKALASA